MPRREKCEAGIPPPLPPTHSLSSKRRGREQEWSFRPILSPFTSFRVWLLLPSNVTNVTSHQDMKVFCAKVFCVKEKSQQLFPSVLQWRQSILLLRLSLSLSPSQKCLLHIGFLSPTREEKTTYTLVYVREATTHNYFPGKMHRETFTRQIAKNYLQNFFGVWEIMLSQIK